MYQYFWIFNFHTLCSVQEIQEPWAIGSLCKTTAHTYCKVYDELRGNGSLRNWNIHKSWGFQQNWLIVEFSNLITDFVLSDIQNSFYEIANEIYRSTLVHVMAWWLVKTKPLPDITTCLSWISYCCWFTKYLLYWILPETSECSKFWVCS